MPNAMQSFEPDFVLIDPEEMRVRQGMQDTRLHAAQSERNEYDAVWGWQASGYDEEPTPTPQLEENYATVWESTLEQL